MMAAAGPPSTSGFFPLLETLEDDAAGESDQIDAYLTIANRLSGDDGRHFLPAVEKHFPRLGKVVLVHVGSASVELSQAALQALGFCVFHSQVALCVSDVFAAEILSALCSLITKSTDKNTCTRALWVISKQSFSANVVGKNVPMVLSSLESVWNRPNIQSVVMEHEALNVIIKMLEQVPTQMKEGAAQWAKVVIPLVVHSAAKVRLRAAAAMEMGLPLLLAQQADVAAAIEPIMVSKLIPELLRLFMSKNETNVLKLWPLFVKLLGKLLHRGGSFINSLLHLEELGFRSSSPTVKKIAFLAWKSLIDNFALNPEILCSSKRMKLLLQPLLSIHVRTETLMLTKVEVWWYLVVQLGPNLSSHFDQVSVPLLQSTFGSTCPSVPGTPSRSSGQSGPSVPGTPKSGNSTFNSLASTPRMSLGPSVQTASTFPSIQLLGLEMLLHYLVGPEVVTCAAKKKLVLSLEPLTHSLLTGASSFTKHAAVLISTIRVGFTSIGKDAPESLLVIIWTRLVQFVSMTIDSSGKKERQGCEVLTSMLQALQSIAETLPADRLLVLLKATVTNIPPRILGSTSYQVGKMDVLNGTPALFLIFLVFNNSNLPAFVEDDRFLVCLQSLITCGLSGPTSPLAFVEAVLGAISRSASSLLVKEQQWKLWSTLVGLLTDAITQSNEVNQGDALEHNFSAMYSVLMFPITHLLDGASLPQAAQKSMLSSWSKLYKVFARCSALVVTAEENICCEELCSKVAAAIDREALKVPSTLNAMASILHVMVECVDFSPYTPQFQQKLNSPHTPMNWVRKQSKALGNLSTFQVLLVQSLHAYLEVLEESSEAIGSTLLSIVSVFFANLALTSAIKVALTSLVQPLVLFYKQASSETSKFTAQLLGKLEKLLGDVLGCLQTHCALAYDSELLAQLTPLMCVLFLHKNKHMRTAITHFWNATFANSISLTYPEEIKPVLSQVKKKTPIILPGFEVVTVSNELSEQFSSESSQLETKLSGIPVSSAGKRDSMLGKAAELKDGTSRKPNKVVSTKLDFDSPKPPSRDVLEEEASIDFVFIPPETKERVLTEHQKEMKRTKRVDIPVMYNNLDASLDTTVFSQYTQSQEDSDKTAAAQNAKGTEETPDKIPPKNEEGKEVLMKELDGRTAETETTESPSQIFQDSDVSVADDKKSNEATENVESKNDTSPNISSSSDLVLGTPQKLNSRRQSFITLEKYSDGKPASPSNSSSFAGLHVACSSQKTFSEASHAFSCLGSQDSDSTVKLSPPDPESPRRPKDCRTKAEPVRLIERLPEDSREDTSVLPDMQTEMESEELIPKETNIEEEPMLDDLLTQTSSEQPRRSGRQRMRPQLPGEDPEEREAKFTHSKRRRSREENKSVSPEAKQTRQNTRTKVAAEESSSSSSSSEGLRTKSCRNSAELSQSTPKDKMSNITKAFSFVDVFLEKPALKKKRTSEPKSSLTENHSQAKKVSPNTIREAEISKGSLDQMIVDLNDGVKNQPATDSQTRTGASQTNGEPQVMKLEEKDEKIDPADTSEMKASSSDIKGHSQEEEGSKICSPLKEPQSETTDQMQSDNIVQGVGASVDSLSQENSPVTPSSSDSQPVTPSLSDSQPVTPSSSDGQLVTPSSSDGQLVTPSSSDGQPVTPSLSDGQPVTPSLSDSQPVTPSSSDGQLVTPSSSDGQPVTPSSSDGQPVTPSSSDGQPVTPSSSDGQPKPARKSRRSDALSETGGSQDKSQHIESVGPRRRSQTALDREVEAGTKGGRTRRSKIQEQSLKCSPKLTPESSQSRDLSGTRFSQNGGRDLRRRSSLKTGVTLESLKSASPEAQNNSLVPKRRGKKSRGSLACAVESKESSGDVEITESLEGKTQVVETPEAQNPQELQQEEESSTKTETDEVSNSATDVRRAEDGKVQSSQPEEQHILESAGLIQDPYLGTADSVLLPQETGERLNVSESSEEMAKEVSEGREVQPEKTSMDLNADHQEPSAGPNDEVVQGEHSQEPPAPITECEGEPASVPNAGTEYEVAPVQDSNADEKNLKDDAEASQACISKQTELVLLDTDGSGQGSPMRPKDQVTGLDIGHSPCNSDTRGTWSPSASPSTSILKKSQKRPLDVETTSPLVKSRRVSFANPIQQQETADDIDRRSLAMGTNSPRRSKSNTVPQSKLVTTPTKGLHVLSPRNLHSPGYKSSKKCLISEMSQEPRAVSRDCIYPALVGCSAPVEAVLSQISSTMWSRGFGQLVRSRNIKTVGDLSALIPGEIKTLPIRSPKISNVKKALQMFEQQRRGRGVELKSFDETEIMTSDLEEPSALHDTDKEEKTSGELATEPEVLLLSSYVPPALDTMALEGSRGPTQGLHPDGLLGELEALSSRMTPVELSSFSPQELVDMHGHLGGMMRHVVAEMQTRLQKL